MAFNRWCVLGIFYLLASGAVGSATTGVVANTTRSELMLPWAPDRVVVKFTSRPPLEVTPKSVSAPGALGRVLAEAHCSGVRKVFGHFREVPPSLDHIYVFTVDVPVLQELIVSFKKLPEVEFTEPDVYFRNPEAGLRWKTSTAGNSSHRSPVQPNDPLFPNQWNLDSAESPDVNAPEAWAITTGSRDFIVAGLDSGVDRTQPDLADKLWRNPGEIPENGLDDDGNGFVDDVYGWDFLEDDNDPSPLRGTSEANHGTGTIGVAAASGNNGEGITGVDWNAKIMGLRAGVIAMLGTQTAEAFTYAAFNGAQAINYSGVAFTHSETFKRAIDFCWERGLVMVCVTGNEFSADVHYPSAYPETIAVGGYGPTGFRSLFSNTGPHMDLCAPAEGIASPTFDGQYNQEGNEGTSWAAPHVTGAASLLKSLYDPPLHPEVIRQLLIQTAGDMEAPGWDPNTGYGRLDIGAAVQRAAGPPGLPPVAILRTPLMNGRVSGLTEFRGAAFTGPPATGTFASYRLEIGSGEIPTQWSLITSGSTPVTDGLLGSYDFSRKAPGKYVVRLKVEDTVGNASEDKVQVLVIEDADFHQGWPKDGLAGVNGSLAVVDLDDDNLMDIVVADDEGLVHVWDHNGSYLPGWPINTGKSGYYGVTSPCTGSPAVGDVDGDGRLEIVVENTDGTLHVLSRDGTPLPGWPLKGASSLTSTPALADLDGDGTLDIAAGDQDRQLHIFDHEGRERPGWPQRGGGVFFSSPAIGDVDGDGTLDITVGNGDGKLYLWHRDGAPFPGFPLEVPAIASDLVPVILEGMTASPAIADLDDDPRQLEIVTANSFGQMEEVHLDGTLSPISPLWQIMLNNSPAVADVNGDRFPEVACGMILALQGLFGVSLWERSPSLGTWGDVAGWPHQAVNHVASPPAILSLDSVPGREVITGCNSDYIYAWDRLNRTPENWTDWDGRRFTGVWNQGTPMVGDIDGDGLNEMAAADRQGRVFVWDETGKYEPSRSEWRTFHANEWRTGLYGQDTLRPAVVRDLAAEDGPEAGSVRFTWTAPGNDHLTGKAARYELRYSAAPITYDTWASATVAAGTQEPHFSGTPETFVLTDQTRGGRYYAALRTWDGSGNGSGLSPSTAFTVSLEPPPTPTPIPPPRAPNYFLAGYLDTSISSAQGGELRFSTYYQTWPPDQRLEFWYGSVPLGYPLPRYLLPGGDRGRYLLHLLVWEGSGELWGIWPYFYVWE